MIIVDPIFSKEKIKSDHSMAFVIMPFREKWSGYIYDEFIKKLVAKSGLKTLRADEMYGRNVLLDIWDGISSARLVIADISAPNENVFYELGIAHTLGKPTILMTQSAERIPFDLRNQRCIVYSDDLPGYGVLEREIPLHLNALMAEPINELHFLRSIMGGFLVRGAANKLELLDSDSKRVRVTDSMEIIGTRENVVLVNKVIEKNGTIENLVCNHRHVMSVFPDLLKVAALFDPPYVGVGDEQYVEFNYDVVDGFDTDRIWRYDCSIEVRDLVFSLKAPANFQGDVKLVEIIKPTEYDIKVLTPRCNDNFVYYEGMIENPEKGKTYAIRW